MVSIRVVRTNREPGTKINHVDAVMYLLIVCLTASGCSKSGEERARSKSPPDTSVINDYLKDYRFTREDFNDSDRVWSFLQRIAGHYYRTACCVCTSSSLSIAGGDDLSGWLHGKEKSEAVFRRLFCDPQFAFEANKWTVVFNVIPSGKGGGGVDEWKVVGDHDPQTNTNRIEKIEITMVKPEGTFSYGLGG